MNYPPNMDLFLVEVEDWGEQYPLHAEADLTFCGYDESGSPEFIGTKEQWSKLTELEKKDSQ